MECKYCDVIKEKKNLLYEDENIIAIIPERPCTKGHIQIISKKHYNTTQEMTEKELQHLVYASSFAATALFENLGAQGTNLVMKSGSLIKKEGNHIHMDVIARNPDDGLNFLWEPKKLAESDMKDAETAIKDKADLIGVKKKKKEVVDLDKKKIGHVGGTNTDKEGCVKEGCSNDGAGSKNYKIISDGIIERNESYLIRQLRRIP